MILDLYQKHQFYVCVEWNNIVEIDDWDNKFKNEIILIDESRRDIENWPCGRCKIIILNNLLFKFKKQFYSKVGYGLLYYYIFETKAKINNNIYYELTMRSEDNNVLNEIYIFDRNFKIEEMEKYYKYYSLKYSLLNKKIKYYKFYFEYLNNNIVIYLKKNRQRSLYYINNKLIKININYYLDYSIHLIYNNNKIKYNYKKYMGLEIEHYCHYMKYVDILYVYYNYKLYN